MGAVTSADGRHEPRDCTDEDCSRWPCQVYKEGFRAGWEAGYPAGHARGYEAGHRAGWEAGYKEGFGDGIDACPRPHGRK